MNSKRLAFAYGLLLCSNPLFAADLVFVSENIYTGNPDQPIAKSMAIEGDTITCVSVNDSCREQALDRCLAEDFFEQFVATLSDGEVDLSPDKDV